MKNITPADVEKELIEGKMLNILDVRNPGEVAGGKIPGAFNIPLGLLEFRMHELDKSKEYTIVCHSGGRSSQASMFLDYQGFKIRNMLGGMLAWAGKTE